MLITLPISELVPGMYVASVTKQHEGVNSIKIKTSGLVRDKSIIKRLVAEGVLELLIDFAKGFDNYILKSNPKDLASDKGIQLQQEMKDEITKRKLLASVLGSSWKSQGYDKSTFENKQV